MKIVAFVPFDEESICYGLIDGENIREINDPFTGEEIKESGKVYKRADVILVTESPVVFMKSENAIIGPEDYIIKPAMCRDLDYEAELAVVIKKECKNISEDEASDYILGYCCANDVTARDLQPKNGQWTIAKGFDTFLPLGPFISDEVDPSSLDIECRLNGRTVQKSNTRNLIFPVPYLVSYLSKCMTLHAGDVILTGTPSGTNHMNNGDVVEVEIEGLGVLRNTVEDEA